MMKLNSTEFIEFFLIQIKLEIYIKINLQSDNQVEFLINKRKNKIFHLLFFSIRFIFETLFVGIFSEIS